MPTLNGNDNELTVQVRKYWGSQKGSIPSTRKTQKQSKDLRAALFCRTNQLSLREVKLIFWPIVSLDPKRVDE